MITYHNGDLLESKCDIICHQVNLEGVMGGGLARKIAEKYPSVEWFYSAMLGKLSFPLGQCVFAKADNGVYVANCFSQNKEFDTVYSAIYTCFNDIIHFCEKYNLKTVGVPYNYGCGIANGDWHMVLAIFKTLFQNKDNIELQIWKL